MDQAPVSVVDIIFIIFRLFHCYPVVAIATDLREGNGAASDRHLEF
jgi:hypothetical protein